MPVFRAVKGLFDNKKCHLLTFVSRGSTILLTIGLRRRNAPAPETAVYRLIIVDDEEEIRKGLASYFPWEELGYTVVATADDGRKAIELVRQGKVDVVFSDIRMPVMSGLDLARAIFEEGHKVPVVFLSAYKDFGYAKQALDFGVRCYVLKPTNYTEITSVFRKLKNELDYRPERPGDPASPPSDRAGPPGPTSSPGPPGNKGDAAIARVQRYLEREYTRATLERAAAIVNKNPQYISRLFKQVTGINFNEYLIRVRMEKAAQLLSDVNYLTYQVSEIVGYSDPKNFTRTFRKHFGVSPREFRRTPS